MTKLERMANRLNGDFRNHLHQAFLDRFGKKLVTRYSFMLDRLVSELPDGADFTLEESMFVVGYADGYAKALKTVRLADNEDRLRRNPDGN
jgi:hypothetical protein